MGIFSCTYCLRTFPHEVEMRICKYLQALTVIVSALSISVFPLLAAEADEADFGFGHGMSFVCG